MNHSFLHAPVSSTVNDVPQSLTPSQVGCSFHLTISIDNTHCVFFCNNTSNVFFLSGTAINTHPFSPPFTQYAPIQTTTDPSRPLLTSSIPSPHSEAPCLVMHQIYPAVSHGILSFLNYIHLQLIVYNLQLPGVFLSRSTFNRASSKMWCFHLLISDPHPTTFISPFSISAPSMAADCWLSNRSCTYFSLNTHLPVSHCFLFGHFAEI